MQKNGLYNFLVTLTSFILVVLIFAVNQTHEWKQIRKQKMRKHQKEKELSIKPVVLIPSLTNKPEYCLTCHEGISEISKSHPTEVYGCVLCHGGQPFSLDKKVAHSGLRGGKNPSALDVVAESCSSAPNGESCHNGFYHKEDRWKNMIDRVKASLQSTCAGAIATVRFTYSRQSSPMPVYGTIEAIDTIDGIHNHPKKIGNYGRFIKQEDEENSLAPVEKKYFENCIEAGCHLNSEAPDKKYFYRSKGCATCHVIYTDDGKYTGNDPTISRQEPKHMMKHEFTTAIPYTQCNHCHNRGTYSLKHLTFNERKDTHPDSLKFLSQNEIRKKRYYIPLAQYAKCEVSLDCIDCHTHNEIMGDGHIYPNKKKAVEVKCPTCHGTIRSLPNEEIVKNQSRKEIIIASFNKNFRWEIGDTLLKSKTGTVFPFIKKRHQKWYQISKVSGKEFKLPLVFGSKCRQTGNERSSSECHRCHDISKKKTF